jgi:hypothetical protein
VEDKFGIQALVRFSFKIWSNFILNMATLKFVGVGRARARRGMPRWPRRRTTRRAHRSRPVTSCPPLGRCHASTAHSSPREPRSAIGRWPAARRQPPPRHADDIVDHEARAKLPRDAPGL